MSQLKAICDFEECEELVDESNIIEHMATHGIRSATDWRLKRWPDGTAVIIDPDAGPPDG